MSNDRIRGFLLPSEEVVPAPINSLIFVESESGNRVHVCASRRHVRELLAACPDTPDERAAELHENLGRSRLPESSAHDPIVIGGWAGGFLVELLDGDQGKRVKFLYTIPNFNNPSGITQPLERRRQVLDVATRHDLLIVEDNPYGLLNLESDPIPAIRSLDSERIIYLGSFSKTFAPGFRVGWALAPHAVREKLVLAQESATLCPPVFSQFAISSYLDSWDWRRQITSFKDMYRARRDAMLEGLSEHMPAGTTWTRPAGGFFVWVTLPEGLDSQAMLPRAVTARVAYVPGPAFYADGFGTRFMRLSYCFPTPERIIEGTRRLGEVLHEELEMRRTFGLGVAGPTSSRDLSGPGPDLS